MKGRAGDTKRREERREGGDRNDGREDVRASVYLHPKTTRRRTTGAIKVQRLSKKKGVRESTTTTSPPV